MATPKIRLNRTLRYRRNCNVLERPYIGRRKVPVLQLERLRLRERVLRNWFHGLQHLPWRAVTNSGTFNLKRWLIPYIISRNMVRLNKNQADSISDGNSRLGSHEMPSFLYHFESKERSARACQSTYTPGHEWLFSFREESFYEFT